mmetsp:Transcript_36609/g.113873  ORF Transcript_36609/g.113873 Transcript_36609/m.113873 type:complete len:271 (+) Transcript_36609:111-923(+)
MVTPTANGGGRQMMQPADYSTAAALEAAVSAQPGGAGLPVFLHIYDVTREHSIRRINSLFAHELSPFKLGGIFHAGVEVNGLEWCFGLRDSTTRYGIWCSEPTSHPSHRYRETVACGRTRLTVPEINHVTSQLLEDYPGHDYDLLRRNCCHFADDFCGRLGVAGVPRWVYRLAHIGAQVDSVLQAARSVQDHLHGLSAPLLSPQRQAALPRQRPCQGPDGCTPPRRRTHPRPSWPGASPGCSPRASQDVGSPAPSEGLGIFGRPACLGAG